ncbi:MAG: type II toxin-antitoxin system HicB family antitoxin [Verrucomicrobia bacterium]|nr:type II toxin-antitoxin system HicB family antitoxin [Verrucomicrobiota bacterium]
MSEVLKYHDYYGSVKPDVESGVLYGKILHVNDLVTYEAASLPELKEAFQEAVNDYLETCREIGKEPDKPYKGSFNVRMQPDLHKQAAITAVEEGKSLNDFVVSAVKQQIDGPSDIHHHHTVEHVVREESKVIEFPEMQPDIYEFPTREGHLSWKTH